MEKVKGQARKASKKQKKGKKVSVKKANALSRDPKLMAQPTGYGRGVTKGVRGTGLSKCAEIYAKALVNPFGEFDELPCVPCAPSDMTYKFRNVIRGSFQTGTNGAGFVSWSPLCASNDTTTSIQYSTASFNGTSFAVAPTAGVVATGKGLLPFPKAAFSSSTPLYARLVASGMRLKNTTAPLYRQGSVMACRVPTNIGLGSFTASALAQSLESVKEEANRPGWFCWNYIPQDQEDLDFPDGSINYDTVRAANNFGLLVQGASTTAPFSSWDFELVEFWEFTSGDPTRPMPSLTKTHADSVGLDRIVEAVSVPVQTLLLKDTARSMAINAIDSMAHSDSAAKTVEDLLGLAGLALPTVEKLVGAFSQMILH